MALTYPYTIVAATDVDAAPIQGNFDAIKTLVDTLGAGAADTTYRTIQAVGIANASTADATARTWYFNGSGFLVTVSGGASGTTAPGADGPATIYLDDADLTLTGETPQLRVRGQVFTNATDPGTSTYTFGLHAVTAPVGAADVISYSVNTTPATGSTAVQGDAAASTAYSVVSSAFSVPADGNYVLGVTTSATLANNALVAFAAQLQVVVTS